MTQHPLLLGLLLFFLQTLLIPLRLSPSSWTAVSLLYSPFLPHGPNDDQDSNDDGAVVPRTRLPATRPHVLPIAVPQLRRLIASYCPSLGPSSRYRPTPYLASGHLQTIWSAKIKPIAPDDVMYKRRILLLPDGGTLSLDFSPPHLADSDATSTVPTVVCLHGLTGGSGETYVRNAVKQLSSSPNDGGLGFRTVVVNFRGCGHTPVTSQQLYSASKTSDLRCALLFLTSVFPRSVFAGLGFSLGANILAKYLGEQGEDTPLRGALILGTPFDLSRGFDLCENNHPGSSRLRMGLTTELYTSTLASNLGRVVMRNADVLSLDPQVAKAVAKLLPSQLPVSPSTVLDKPKEPKTKLRPGAGLEGASRTRRAWNRLAHSGVRMRRKPIEASRSVAPSHPRTMRFIDETSTAILGGHHKPYGEFPFACAEDYYAAGSSARVIHGVRRPLLSIHSRDDPVVPFALVDRVKQAMGLDLPPSTASPVEVNPNIVLASTLLGGHMGWWSGWWPRRWISQPIKEFMSMLLTAPECAHLTDPKTYASSTAVTLRTEAVKIDILPLEVLRPYADNHLDRPSQQLNTHPYTPTPTAAAHVHPGRLPDVVTVERKRSSLRRWPEAPADVSSLLPQGDERVFPELAQDSFTRAAYDAAAAEKEPLSAAAEAQVMANVVARQDAENAEVGLPSRPSAPLPGEQNGQLATPTVVTGADHLAWLTTHVLEHVPLIHPFHHAWYTDPQYGCRRREDMISRGSRLILTMRRDPDRPEVGFTEIPPHTRVAGAGDTFLGGWDAPGRKVPGRKTYMVDVVAGL